MMMMRTNLYTLEVATLFWCSLLFTSSLAFTSTRRIDQKKLLSVYFSCLPNTFVKSKYDFLFFLSKSNNGDDDDGRTEQMQINRNKSNSSLFIYFYLIFILYGEKYQFTIKGFSFNFLFIVDPTIRCFLHLRVSSLCPIPPALKVTLKMCWNSFQMLVI